MLVPSSNDVETNVSRVGESLAGSGVSAVGSGICPFDGINIKEAALCTEYGFGFIGGVFSAFGVREVVGVVGVGG